MDVDQIGAQDADIPFDEAWYLEKYPLIAEVVRQGGFKSGWQHYVLHGRFEGRIPVRPMSPPAVDDNAVPPVPPAPVAYSAVPPVSLAPVADSAVPPASPLPVADSAVPPASSAPVADSAVPPVPPPPYDAHNGAGFLTPTDLTVTPTTLTRVALIGSCMLNSWSFQDRNPSGCPVDLILVNNAARLPTLDHEVLASYDFAVVQLPLRPIISDSGPWKHAYTNEAAYENLFGWACENIEHHLHNWMQWNREFGMLTFVANFLVPQQNPMGRLFPRYNLANPEYFVSRLNEHLETVVRRSKNAYVFDLDRVTTSIGRRYAQDDTVGPISHNGMLAHFPPRNVRIEPIAPITDHYDVRWHRVLPEMVWAELLAMYRTVRQIDPVKVVVVDLDDTLWQGVSGDLDEISGNMAEGWPMGLVEALMYLKKRGILLAIASKNEESRVREIWPRIFSNRLHLEDFAAVRINWRPKAENVREILEGMNLLPRNAVFIDDNPAERDAMLRAFPDMRVLGRYPYYLKRVLLWSSETQVPVVTEESSRRTEMIQAQFTRETQRKEMSRDQFLREAEIKITMLPINGTDHQRFARVFELINKTNQYNTTGRRWKIEECETFFRDDGRMMAFEVTDRFTSYGLVGVVIFRSGLIEQWVMSCRVLGYQVENAVMAIIVAAMRASDPGPVTGRLLHTDVNFPCRDLFRDCGFTETGEAGAWVLAPETALDVPEHVTIS